MSRPHWFLRFGGWFGILALVGCAIHPPTARTPSASPVRWPAEWEGGEISPDLSLYAPANSRADQNPAVTVVVAISGGGMRAANFGAGVLRELERLPVDGHRFNLLREVDYFSTVSGGGIAAGSYLRARRRYLDADEDSSDFRYAGALGRGDRAREGRDDRGSTPLKSTLRHNFQSFVWGLIDPRNIGFRDRGDAFENTLDRQLLRDTGGRSLNFGDLFVPAGSGRTPDMPYWFVNTTTVGNGTILPLAPDTLSALGVNGYSHRRKWQRLTNVYDFPLAAAAKASASFPGAIPASTLGLTAPKPTYLQLMDGGVGDNLGVLTALHLLTNHVHDRTAKLLIIVDAYQKQPDPFNHRRPPPRLLNQLLNTANLPLDAWHAGFENEVRRWETEINRTTPEFPMRHVVIGFDSLVVSEGDEPTRKLAEKTRAVETRLNILPATQELLFKAARQAVRNQSAELSAAVRESFRLEAPAH